MQKGKKTKIILLHFEDGDPVSFPSFPSSFHSLPSLAGFLSLANSSSDALFLLFDLQEDPMNWSKGRKWFTVSESGGESTRL